MEKIYIQENSKTTKKVNVKNDNELFENQTNSTSVEEKNRFNEIIYEFSEFTGEEREDFVGLVANNIGDSIQPLQKKNGRKSFCGVELYKRLRREICGVELYREDRTKHCGVEKYIEGQSPDCPGSYPEDSYWTGWHPENWNRGQPGGKCNHADYDNYPYRVARRQSKTITRNRELDDITLYRWLCVKPAFNDKCRLKEFGVERYKKCRNSEHDPERYKACRKPSFGVDRYKECSYYLMPSEVQQYINGKKQLMSFMGETLINQKGLFFAFIENEVGMACTIKRFETDPLFDAVTTELKTIFAAKFGKEYVDSNYNCNDEEPVKDIDDFRCPTGDENTRICKSHVSYITAKKWFSVTRKDIKNLLSDIPALTNNSIKNQLNDLQRRLDKVTI